MCIRDSYLSEYCFGDFYTRNGLDLPTRELITMVMLATLGGCENQLRAHVGANLTVGNNRDTLIETITQCQQMCIRDRFRPGG